MQYIEKVRPTKFDCKLFRHEKLSPIGARGVSAQHCNGVRPTGPRRSLTNPIERAPQGQVQFAVQLVPSRACSTGM